ncbi:hypothetical protein PI125_g904 [Phytophthora idaei]|nr:hypothetical protein PI125_g904 [Phytophthora idaei]KAG3173828.1 hypothetical protein PI126_g662 [Phytophthora idaei]
MPNAAVSALLVTTVRLGRSLQNHALQGLTERHRASSAQRARVHALRSMEYCRAFPHLVQRGITARSRQQCRESVEQ